MGRKFFDISLWVFWVLMAIMGFLLLPYFKDGLYNDDKLTEWVKLFDTIQPKPEESNLPLPLPKDSSNVYFLTWEWNDLENIKQSIRFSFEKNSLAMATENRLKGPVENDFSNFHPIYAHLYKHDRVLLADMIASFKKSIKAKNLSFLESLNYVVSSIQHIPYTLVVEKPCPFKDYNQPCKALPNNKGCCGNVMPFGVYSPFEFVYNKTGDCDTRALLAYTILKELGYDVAVMVSYDREHAVLGVANFGSITGSYGVNSFGKKYFLWELTTKGMHLGQGVEGSDWLATLE